jgi:superfamily II DNA or RNA helicase
VDAPLRLTTAEQVRARIASLLLGEDAPAATLGDVTLKPHQVSAVTRIRVAMREFGGALLCDEVGMGKTFVAAAIARDYSAPLVVAPAVLFPMWKDALATAAIRAEFLSFEKLSRLGVDSPAGSGISSNSSFNRPHDLVIVDEAHHARNPATRRYARLRQLTRDAKVLLLSATPIHNRRSELSALLSLFLGSRAGALSSAESARCVLRRGHDQIESRDLIPGILPLQALRISDDPSVVESLMSLPDPLPVRDGGSGGVLIGRGLVHQWASSEATLHSAIRRRLARAWALVASLEAGTYPTEQELRAWTFDDGALQLGFPELLSATIGDTHVLLVCVRRHATALDAIRARCQRPSTLDRERALHILAICRSHPGAKIVAFSQYAPTVSMLYAALRDSARVAMLTSHGARVAGGKMSRREALARFAPDALRISRPPPSEAIDLLLTTDLLSEGVNLQDARIIVHLDLPWTAGRMEQRVGRLARMGSPHTEIQPYLIRPPASAETLLDTESLITRKWDCARRAVGSSASPPLGEPVSGEGTTSQTSVSQLTESLRMILGRWRQGEPGDPKNKFSVPDMDILIAAAKSSKSGFLAALTIEEENRLVVSIGGEMATDVESQIAACKMASGESVEMSWDDFARAEADIRSWAETERASALAGTSTSKALRRTRLANRIDRAIEAAPPHFRSKRLVLATRARAVVTSQQSAAIEAELASLADSDLADDEWLRAVARIGAENHSISPRGIRTWRIRALLLLSAYPKNPVRTFRS